MKEVPGKDSRAESKGGGGGIIECIKQENNINTCEFFAAIG